MQHGKITLKKIGQFVLILLLLPPVCFLLWIWAALAWIQYRPLPPVPQYGIDYSVADAGELSDEYLKHYFASHYSPEELGYETRLTYTGKVVHFDEAVEARDEAKRKDLIATESRRLGLTQNHYSDHVDAVASHGQALVRTWETWTLFHMGKPAARIPKGIRSYSWEPHAVIYGFHVLNARGEAIGNGRIATGYATSGGTSNPHGRWLPLIWQGDGRQPEDLNGHIDTRIGWYLYRAIDINGGGQILCIARRTDARGAEEDHLEGSHWVVLTPKR